MVIDGLEILLTANELQALVQISELDYFKVGYGRIVLSIDGVESNKELAQVKSASTDPQASVELKGTVTVVVKDVSPDGLTSAFEINFLVSDKIADEKDSTEADDDDDSGSNAVGYDTALFAEKLLKSVTEEKTTLRN